MKSIRLLVSALTCALSLPLLAADAFNLSDKPWRGVPVPPEKSAKQTHIGDHSLRWDAGTGEFNAIFFRFGKDLTAYDQLSFWLYAEKDTYATIQIVFESGSESNVFETQIVIDQAGKWNRYVLPFSSFRKTREPKGWNEITGLLFTTNRHGNKPVPGTVLYFSDMKLEIAE
jgi:hypothetical protein